MSPSLNAAIRKLLDDAISAIKEGQSLPKCPPELSLIQSGAVGKISAVISILEKENEPSKGTQP